MKPDKIYESTDERLKEYYVEYSKEEEELLKGVEEEK
jgi:hypothetical protein